MPLRPRTKQPRHYNPLRPQLLPGMQEGVSKVVHAMQWETEDRGSL